MPDEKPAEENPPNQESKPSSPPEAATSASPDTPKPEIPPAPEKDASPITEDKDSLEKKQSFAIQCLQYLSIGKYFLVLAKKHPAEWPGMAVPAASPKPPQDIRIDFKPKEQRSNQIFVVHGSHEDMKNHVVELLKKIGLNPVLSRDPTNTAKAMEEKLGDPLQMDFAVVILSGDDFVYPKNGKPAEAKLRATQITVFELGYLLGKFKRQNVFVLYHEQKSFLLPTGLNDVMYTPHDKTGHWRKELIQRLRLCGYTIDKKFDE